MKFILFIVAFLTPTVAFAADLVATGWDWTFSIYLLAGGAIATGLGWLLMKLGKFLDGKIENEFFSGVIRRLTGSIGDAVAMVDQTLRKEIEAAKDPASPEGSKITKKEAKQMGEAVWEALLSEYGGWGGLFKTLKRIGIGDETAARKKVDTMIEAAVNTQKMRKAATDPR